MTTTAGGVTTNSDATVIREELHRARRAQCCGAAISTATLNFLVYVDDAKHRSWVAERALRIAEKHPSRLLLLDASDPGEGASVSATGRGGTSASGSTVHSERVELGVGRLAPVALRSLVQSLTLPDIPTVLWWTASPSVREQHLSELLPLSNSIVVDSSGCRGDAETVRELGQLCARRPDVVVRDLAWMRLLPWQDVIAQFFDDAVFLKDLSSLTRLEVVSGSEAEALYLAGWLASRLGWTPAGPSTFRGSDGRAIAFEHRREGRIRRVQLVALTSADSRFIGRVTDGSDAVCLMVEGRKQRPCAYTPLQSIDNMSLIERAILSSRRDAIFEGALRTVRELLG
jgi:glucose-6-phosphate dehydrogenase assembly protein OpcA